MVLIRGSNMTSTLRVALYGRVSTRDAGQDTENQLVQLRQFCQRNGWEIAHEYIDKTSGKTANRTQFQQMFTDAAQRRFDAVLVWALDRFTREGVAETFEHVKRLVSDGVQFVSFTEEHFRTTGPAGELMLAVAAWIAKQERIRISERTRAGLQRAVREGKTLGRPKVVCDRYGVRELRTQGLSLGKIATQLNLPKTTVARIARASIS